MSAARGAGIVDAATLVVVDQRSAVPRVLMGRRSLTARFLPGHDVFPGGAVDPEDHDAVVATEPNALVLAHLGRAARPGLARALAIAAARELSEETGLSLGEPPHLGGLRYLCRAVTPPVSPIRFDARFLVVDREMLQAASPDEPLLVGGELHDLAWRNLDDLASLRLAPPTRAALTLLVDRLSGDAAWPDHADAPLPVLVGGRGWGSE